MADVFTGVIGSGGGSTIPAVPDKRFRFLRVEVDGNVPSLLVLGYVDAHPNGPIEVWYSATREVLRLQGGRIVGLTGSSHDWRWVQGGTAVRAWPDVPAAGFSYQRQTDRAQDNAHSVREQVRVQPWAGVPPIDLLPSLPFAKAQGYRWYREQALPLDPANQPALPDAWYAWGKHLGAEMVVYSEQCVAVDFCLKMQRWPLMDDAP